MLGFLVPSMLGAFRAALAAVAGPHAASPDWRDVALLASALTAASGVAAHMALGTYSGVAWSGGLLLATLLLRVPSWWLALAAANAPLSLRAGACLSWLALLLTVCLGMALAIDRGEPFLPAGHQQALFGHVHLGLGGFALLMLVSFGERLVPGFAFAAAPPRELATAQVALVAIGAFGLAATMPFVQSPGPWFGFCLFLSGLLVLADLLRRCLQRIPVAKARAGRGPEVLVLSVSGICLSVALALGMALLQGLADDPSLQLGYGAVLLVGTFGSIGLLLGPLPSPPCWWMAIAWTLGVVALLLAIGLREPRLVTAAVLLLAFSVVIDLVRGVRASRAPLPSAAT